ncbi:MAG: proline dehydrogenase family protein [Bacteroidota bacterium]|nr:proline dehydrogenase family protein [Bacteroidota bacterium]
MSFFNNLIVSTVQAMPKPIVGFFSKKYIAGDYLDEAIDVVKEFNSKNILATMDVLGESVTNKSEVEEAKKQFLDVLDGINDNKLNANISVKPSQMGILLDRQYGVNTIKDLVARAAGYNNFVRIDMEDATTTDLTFELLAELKKEYSNVGVVVQACLKRTYDDVVLLNKAGTNYRLCKGIYNESPAIAYKGKQQIRDNYMKILELMLKNGNYVGIATHDEYLINKAKELIEKLNIPRDKFEFQMLLGVRADLRNKINKEGYKIRIYVPYGIDWYPYSIRRLKENPQMAGHIFKALFGF